MPLPLKKITETDAKRPASYNVCLFLGLRLNKPRVFQMKMDELKIGLLAAILLLGCQKKDTESGSNIPPPKSSKSEPNNSILVFPAPDEKTCFPLLEGSYWVYQTVQDGQKQENTREVDSVVSLTKSDSGFKAVVKETDADGATIITNYNVDAKGLVWSRRGKATEFEPFAALLPKQGEKFGGLTAELKCWDSNESASDCALLQPYRADEDSLTEEQRMGWNGLFFKRGIGLQARAGVEISSELIEYRIGLNGPLVRK